MKLNPTLNQLRLLRGRYRMGWSIERLAKGTCFTKKQIEQILTNFNHYWKQAGGW